MIFLGADHAGFNLKNKIKKFLIKERYKVTDKGNLKYNKDDDYPIYAKKVAKAVAREKHKLGGKGILFCGSAEGMCIAANRFKKIRAVAVWNIRDAKLSREHNDADILCLSGRFMSFEKAKKIVKVWLETPFSNEERHIRRIKEIDNA